MPELPEVEQYRRLAERSALGRTIAAVVAEDAWFRKRGTTVAALRTALEGSTFTAARRTGKLLLLDASSGAVLGLRFGMTGTLLVDGEAGIDELVYGSHRASPSWDRFTVVFGDGGKLCVNDPRRLGGVELDPDVAALGPDAHGITPTQLRQALVGSRVALKARLMDQSHVAGVGNLVADEALWRAGLDPVRPAGSLAASEVAALRSALRSTLRDLLRRGGSHTGDLWEHRVPGGLCPIDGAELVRRTVGGRTTWSCPRHQR